MHNILGLMHNITRLASEQLKSRGFFNLAGLKPAKLSLTRDFNVQEAESRLYDALQRDVHQEQRLM